MAVKSVEASSPCILVSTPFRLFVTRKLEQIPLWTFAGDYFWTNFNKNIGCVVRTNF